MGRGCRKVTRVFPLNAVTQSPRDLRTAPKKRPHSPARSKARSAIERGRTSFMARQMAVWADAASSEEGRKASSRPVDLVHLSRYTLGARELEAEVLEL